MKTIRNFLFVLLFVAGLASCGGMDETYKEFIGEGPIVYIGKVDSLKAYAGRNRVMLEWKKLLDPRAATARIFWENGAKSAEVQLEKEARQTQFVVNDLAEGTYVFEVYTYDTHGNSSIRSEVPASVYGSTYEALLFNTKVKKAVLKDGVLTVTFSESQEATFRGSEITYVDGQGNNKTVFLEAPGKEIKINDFSGDYILYRSIYLPEETAIDYFYSEPDRFIIN